MLNFNLITPDSEKSEENKKIVQEFNLSKMKKRVLSIVCSTEKLNEIASGSRDFVKESSNYWCSRLTEMKPDVDVRKIPIYEIKFKNFDFLEIKNGNKKDSNVLVFRFNPTTAVIKGQDLQFVINIGDPFYSNFEILFSSRYFFLKMH